MKTAWNSVIILQTANERLKTAVFNHQLLAFACLAYAVFAWPLLVVAGALLVFLGAGLVISASIVTAILSPILIVALQSVFAATWGFYSLLMWAINMVGKYIISKDVITIDHSDVSETILWNEREVTKKH